MLKKETINAFAKFAGVEPSDLMAKIKSEGEEDITLQKVNVFTDTQLDQRIQNEKTTSYNEGKTAGVEMEVKAKKKALGYEFEGKDLDSLFTHHTTKVKEGFEKPDKKVAELEADILKLNKAHGIEIESLTNEKLGFEKKFNSSVINNELLSIIPEGTSLAKTDLMTLFNANYQVEKEEGKTIVKQNGVTLKDEKTASPLSLKDVLMNWGTEKKYITGQSGRGGGNEPGAGSSTNSISKFQENWMKQNPGKSVNDQQYQEDYGNWRKDNKEVVA